MLAADDETAEAVQTQSDGSMGRTRTLPFTWFIVTPLILLALDLARRSMYEVAAANGSDAVSTLLAAPLLGSVLWAVAITADLLLARADHHELRRRGIDRPMPWGWAAMGGIYLIGRGVVVVRRTGRGARPTWIGLGIVVLVTTVRLLHLV